MFVFHNINIYLLNLKSSFKTRISFLSIINQKKSRCIIILKHLDTIFYIFYLNKNDASKLQVDGHYLFGRFKETVEDEKGKENEDI